jgi:hypothetical protein
MPELKGRWIWGLALASFVLAAGTGAYFRFTMVTPLPGVHEFIRHAHSHLMFFSWVTPALILLIGLELGRRGLATRGFALTALLSALGGLLTYLPFLRSGYHLTPIAGKALPISMLASGLNGLFWYSFVALYVISTWRVKRDARLRLFDVAVALLVVSTVGIGALAFLGATAQVQRPVMLALVDWFLTLFADGWFGLAILGQAALQVSKQRLARWPLGPLAWLLALGMVVRSVGRFANDALHLQWAPGVEGMGGALAALAWLVLVPAVWRVERGPAVSSEALRGATLLLRQLALTLLLVKGLVELIGSPPALSVWLSQPALRVFFLHAFLLGAVSFSLIAAMRAALGRGAFRAAPAFAVAVAVMVAALLPLTPVWPRAWAGPWILPAAAYTSLGPLLVALLALLRLDLGYARRAPLPPSPAEAPVATGQ